MAKKRYFPVELLSALRKLPLEEHMPDGSEHPRFAYGGFRIDELTEKYQMNQGLAFKVSRMFSWWIHALPLMNLPEPTQLALTRCAYSWGAKPAQDMLRCRLNICPWCRALKISAIRRDIRKLKPVGVVWRGGRYDYMQRLLRRPRHTLCSIRDVRRWQAPFPGTGQEWHVNVVFFLSVEATREEGTPAMMREFSEQNLEWAIDWTVKLNEDLFMDLQQLADYLERVRGMQLYTGPRGEDDAPDAG